jgi:hypothetical protein
MAALRIFISYSHDSREHMERVWQLCERLRQDGIDCRIDQHEFSPAEGWPRWCMYQVQEAKFVLVLCSANYKDRLEGRVKSGIGLGTKWEGFVITQELYEAEGMNTKFIPVVLSREDVASIPLQLHAATFYDFSTDDGYDDMFRHLTNQPARRPSGVASDVRSMVAGERKQNFSGGSSRPREIPDLEREMYKHRD